MYIVLNWFLPPVKYYGVFCVDPWYIILIESIWIPGCSITKYRKVQEGNVCGIVINPGAFCLSTSTIVNCFLCWWTNNVKHDETLLSFFFSFGFFDHSSDQFGSSVLDEKPKRAHNCEDVGLNVGFQLYVISCLLMPQSPCTWLITFKVKKKKKKEKKG